MQNPRNGTFRLTQASSICYFSSGCDSVRTYCQTHSRQCLAHGCPTPRATWMHLACSRIVRLADSSIDSEKYVWTPDRNRLHCEARSMYTLMKIARDIETVRKGFSVICVQSSRIGQLSPQQRKLTTSELIEKAYDIIQTAHQAVRHW